MKAKKPHRYRVCGTPSRTGCITCKIRRVKCGEEKPFCRRCTSTGRKCDGYAPVSILAPNPRSLSFNPPQDPMELKTLHFFTTFTTPALSGNFCSHFWQHIVLQASVVEPSVRHAIIAIGAVHQDFITRQQSPHGCHDLSMQAFAFRQYTKAISYLQQLMTIRTPPLDITLISCILFTSFDCLLRNHASAMIHLKAGLKILEDINSHKMLGIDIFQEWEREFTPMLLGLGIRAAAIVNPKNHHDLIDTPRLPSPLIDPTLHDTDLLSSSTIPIDPALLETSTSISPSDPSLSPSPKIPLQPTHLVSFQSFDEGRRALYSLASEITSDQKSSRNHYTPSQIQNSWSPMNQRHTVSLKNWSEAFDQYLSTNTRGHPSVDRVLRGATLLKVHCLVLQILVGTPNPVEDKFDQVLILCEGLAMTRPKGGCITSSLNFNTDIGMISPLLYMAVEGPSPACRWRAIDLLSLSLGSEDSEGSWPTEDAKRIIARISEAFPDDEVAHFMQMRGPEVEYTMWNELAVRLQHRINYPFRQEEDTSDQPIKREPRPSSRSVPFSRPGSA
ncbi:hypothetical protein B7494_g7782 [Chlorociboria aeruginascens]|nr:hypothetical protein B7494_g7782 [Chlorociboria aeruginascens]